MAEGFSLDGLRLRALELASQDGGTDEEIVARAYRYFAFFTGADLAGQIAQLAYETEQHRSAIMSLVDEFRAEVEGVRDLKAAVETAFQKIEEKLNAALADDASQAEQRQQLEGLRTDLATARSELADIVVKHTPADTGGGGTGGGEPPPPPPPPDGGGTNPPPDTGNPPPPDAGGTDGEPPAPV